MNNKKYISLGLVIVTVLVAGWFFVQPAKDVHQTMNNNLNFNTKDYSVVYTFPANEGDDYVAESYEWTSGGETVENWSTLITTHKLQPNTGVPLSAEAYAQNVAAMQQKGGAQMLETSVINNLDAAAYVDIKNPPFVLVYLHQGTAGQSAELSIQKISNGANGTVNSMIYASRMDLSTEAAIDTYLESDMYKTARMEVIKAVFPY